MGPHITLKQLDSYNNKRLLAYYLYINFVTKFMPTLSIYYSYNTTNYAIIVQYFIN